MVMPLARNGSDNERTRPTTACFGRGVDGVVSKWPDPRQRGGGHDRAAGHLGDDRPHTESNAVDVDAKHSPVVVEADRKEVGAGDNSGVEMDEVEVFDRRDDAIPLFGIADIRADELAVDLVREYLARGGGARQVDDGHGRATGREHARGLGADARCAAGDDRVLPLHRVHMFAAMLLRVGSPLCWRPLGPRSRAPQREHR